MADFFSNLAGHVLGAEPEVEPLLPPRFAPWPNVPATNTLTPPPELVDRPASAEASAFPPPLIAPDRPAIDTPLPTFRQMSQVASAPRHLVEPDLPPVPQDTLETAAAERGDSRQDVTTPVSPSNQPLPMAADEPPMPPLVHDPAPAPRTARPTAPESEPFIQRRAVPGAAVAPTRQGGTPSSSPTAATVAATPGGPPQVAFAPGERTEPPVFTAKDVPIRPSHDQPLPTPASESTPGRPDASPATTAVPGGLETAPGALIAPDQVTPQSARDGSLVHRQPGQPTTPLAPPPHTTIGQSSPASNETKASIATMKPEPATRPHRPAAPARNQPQVQTQHVTPDDRGTFPGPREPTILPVPEPPAAEASPFTAEGPAFPRPQQALPSTGEPEPAPTVRVTIGRVVVRAAPADERPPSRRVELPRPPISLEEYLQGRRGGER